MKLSEFTKFVDASCSGRVNDLGLIYPAMGLPGEAGECVDRIKKIVRDGREPTKKDIRYISLELGDVLWYATRIANLLDLDWEDIMDANVRKLRKRHAKNNNRQRRKEKPSHRNRSA